MKIALAQLNYKVGDFEQNSSKIIEAINQSKSEACDLVVFSELALCGYIPHDLLEQKDFIDRNMAFLDKIKTYTSGIAVLLGTPRINTSESGKKLYNAAVLIKDGEIRQEFYKTLLPTYDVFDDYRYFEPNTHFELLELNGKKIAVTICEDLWDKQEANYSFAKEKQYTLSPLAELNKLKPDFVINIAGSPFSYNQENLRKTILINNAKKYGLPLIYVNQVGGNTELIYDGGSRALNERGETILQMPHFREAVSTINTDDFTHTDPVAEAGTDRIDKMRDALVLGIRDYFRKSGFKRAVLGLSGGIDSALTAALLAEAIGGKNILGVLMPSQYSSSHSVSDAEKLAKNLDMPYHTIPIRDSFGSVKSSLATIFSDKKEDVTEENIQARLRGVLLMAASNKFGHMLVNTSNKSEAAVGYTTLYGDMNGGLSVLGDVYKSDVFRMARRINQNSEIIPENSISKPPSAELRPGQKDEDSLPAYDELDGILFHYIEKKASASEIIKAGYQPETVRKVLAMVNRNEYKRFQAPPVLRVSSKAFGFGRRMPLVARYS
jgi:NAD+ synthase (glutamine-hydrolysing)